MDLDDLSFVELCAMFAIPMITGGFLGKVWDSWTTRRTRELNEEDIANRIATQLREELRAENALLKTRLDVVIAALLRLTDAVDDVLTEATGLDEVGRKKLREANYAAKLAT